MNYTQAKLIALCPDTYQPEEWHEAAVFLLGKLNATSEDMSDAEELAFLVSRQRRQVNACVNEIAD